ncbi:MAG: hypothetical protein KY476_03105 [Planctomycetes bacterium]|nr:hypothetical protein [Planctomycetota bacterium]
MGGVLANFGINAAVAGLLVIGRTSVPLWGLGGVAADVVATSFLLPLLFCLIATPLIRRQVRDGKVAALRRDEVPRAIAKLPGRARLRGIVLGAAATAIVGPLAVLALATLGPTEFSHSSFVIFKATYAALLAAIVGPIIAVTALMERPPH